VHDPIWARAFVVEANGTALANVVLDLVGIANGAIYEIMDGVVEATGGAIHRDAILVASTHTHAAPDLQGLWGGSSAEYRQYVIDHTVAAIVEAYQTRKPSRIYLSNGTAQGNNRRGHGYTDEEVTVLDIVDNDTNRRAGTVVNFAVRRADRSSGDCKRRLTGSGGGRRVWTTARCTWQAHPGMPECLHVVYLRHSLRVLTPA